MISFQYDYLQINMMNQARQIVRRGVVCTLCGGKGHFPAECPWTKRQTIEIPQELNDKLKELINA